MTIEISVTDVLRNFSDYINRVVYRGERFTLLRGGKPVAELAGVTAGARLGDLQQILAALPRLESEAAEDFSQDLERARCELERREPRDPWAS